jgi:hypothetical protein
VRQFSEAGRHGDSEAAGRREQPAQVDEGLTALVGRQSVHDVERDDAVERLRPSRQRADGVGEGAIGDVSAEQMDLLAWRAGRVDNEARVVATATQKPAPTLCCFGHKATAASTHLEDAFARLQVGQPKRGLSIRVLAGIGIVAAAHHMRKGGVDLGEGVDVDYGGGLG